MPAELGGCFYAMGTFAEHVPRDTAPTALLSRARIVMKFELS